MTYIPHDYGHERLIAALKSLPRVYKSRVASQLDRISMCNRVPLGRTEEGYEPVRTDDGRLVVKGWHCNHPLCHKAAVSKAEKTAEKYLLRAMTRVKFEHYALTLTSVPVVGKSLNDAYREVERARVKFLADPSVQKVLRGGLWRTEMTAGDREGDGRSWYVHIHVLADANLNSKRKERLRWLWNTYVKEQSRERPYYDLYAEPVEVMDAYIRYMRKEMDYSEWTHDELVEMCKFLMAHRAPVLMGAFGSWSDRTSEGRKYAAAKRAVLGLESRLDPADPTKYDLKLAHKKCYKPDNIDKIDRSGDFPTDRDISLRIQDQQPAADLNISIPKSSCPGLGAIQIPAIDFTDIRIVTRKVESSGREVILGIYPAVRGHGMEVEDAAVAELVGASVGKFFRKLRVSLLEEKEFIGVHTGTVYKGKEIYPQYRHLIQETPSDHPSQAQDS